MFTGSRHIWGKIMAPSGRLVLLQLQACGSDKMRGADGDGPCTMKAVLCIQSVTITNGMLILIYSSIQFHIYYGFALFPHFFISQVCFVHENINFAHFPTSDCWMCCTFQVPQSFFFCIEMRLHLWRVWIFVWFYCQTASSALWNNLAPGHTFYDFGTALIEIVIFFIIQLSQFRPQKYFYTRIPHEN